MLVCIHDASPAYERELRALIHDLAPLVGRRLTLGVVPDWHGAWPLAAHRDCCRFLQESSAELLLHGCIHQRRSGRGPITWLCGGSDEMNGLDRAGTQRSLAHGQQVFTEVFGAPARGFLAPAWQQGHVRHMDLRALALEHVLGFFSLASFGGRHVPLATWTWDLGRWGWPGHLGHATGRLLHSLGGRVPVLALHPRDAERGFRSTILRLVRELLDSGHEPGTVAGLLETRHAEADV